MPYLPDAPMEERCKQAQKNVQLITRLQ
jgi:hypothetical protein